jgi:hypothetical protein
LEFSYFLAITSKRQFMGHITVPKMKLTPVQGGVLPAPPSSELEITDVLCDDGHRSFPNIDISPLPGFSMRDIARNRADIHSKVPETPRRAGYGERIS